MINLLSVATLKKTLSNAERKILRGKSYSLKPVVMIGQRGVSEAVLSEIDVALETHKLMKVRFRSADRELRTQYSKFIANTVGAELIFQIGSVAVFFRKTAGDDV